MTPQMVKKMQYFIKTWKKYQEIKKGQLRKA